MINSTQNSIQFTPSIASQSSPGLTSSNFSYPNNTNIMNTDIGEDTGYQQLESEGDENEENLA